MGIKGTSIDKRGSESLARYPERSYGLEDAEFADIEERRRRLELSYRGSPPSDAFSELSSTSFRASPGYITRVLETRWKQDSGTREAVRKTCWRFLS